MVKHVWIKLFVFYIFTSNSNTRTWLSIELISNLQLTIGSIPGHDLRLERTLESALMVMEALEGYEEKFKFDIFGHSGEESALPFVKINQVCFFFLIKTL